MSHSLDCFSEAEILNILKSSSRDGWQYAALYFRSLLDRQLYEAAALALIVFRFIFTAMANGNSRMYHSKEMIKLISRSRPLCRGRRDHLGSGHTLLGCKKKLD